MRPQFSIMARQLAKLLPAVWNISKTVACTSTASAAVQALLPATKQLLPSLGALSTRGLHFSRLLGQEASHDVPATQKPDEPPRKYRNLGDKELWHEAWMYEDRFGSEEDPIVVPSLEAERIIGATDPEDDNLVVWGILRAGDPPRQLVEGGEYYVLKEVPYVAKVGDVLEQIEAGQSTPLPK